MCRIVIFCLISFLWANVVICQEKSPNRLKVVGLPLIFYSPDTKLGGGAGGILTFNFPKDSIRARRSSITVGAVYTQLNQILLYFPFQLFPQNQKYWISGEVGYFRYVYNFFGIGNDYSRHYRENYTAQYPRVRLNLAHKVGSNLFVGLRYAFDEIRILKKDSLGLLASNAIVGSSGGTISGGGAVAIYDNRDQIFSATKGWLIDASIYAEGRFSGSDFRYQRLALDAAHYIAMGKRSVLALNGVAIFSVGDLPFQQMPVLGGPKRSRGYFEGKYRDKNLLLLQTEGRFDLGRRFGAVAFAGMGVVAAKIGDFSTSNLRFNAGVGARFAVDKAQRINLRADFAVGYHSSGFYLTFGEAF